MPGSNFNRALPISRAVSLTSPLPLSNPPDSPWKYKNSPRTIKWSKNLFRCRSYSIHRKVQCQSVVSLLICFDQQVYSAVIPSQGLQIVKSTQVAMLSLAMWGQFLVAMPSIVLTARFFTTPSWFWCRLFFHLKSCRLWSLPRFWCLALRWGDRLRFWCRRLSKGRRSSTLPFFWFARWKKNFHSLIQFHQVNRNYIIVPPCTKGTLDWLLCLDYNR